MLKASVSHDQTISVTIVITLSLVYQAWLVFGHSTLICSHFPEEMKH